jgi:hypothetical protein
MRESFVCTKAVALRMRARHGTVAGTTVVQELFRKVAAGNGYRGVAGRVSVNEEGATLPKQAELGEAVLATGNHLRGVIRRDVRGEELAIYYCMAFTTSGMRSFIWQKTWLHWGSPFLKKSLPY